jgi:hypothetical protein
MVRVPRVQEGLDCRSGRVGGEALLEVASSHPLARYAAPNANFVLVVAPHNGLGRAERAKEILLTRRGLCRDIKWQSP